MAGLLKRAERALEKLDRQASSIVSSPGDGGNGSNNKFYRVSYDDESDDDIHGPGFLETLEDSISQELMSESTISLPSTSVHYESRGKYNTSDVKELRSSLEAAQKEVVEVRKEVFQSSTDLRQLQLERDQCVERNESLRDQVLELKKEKRSLQWKLETLSLSSTNGTSTSTTTNSSTATGGESNSDAELCVKLKIELEKQRQEFDGTIDDLSVEIAQKQHDANVLEGRMKFLAEKHVRAEEDASRLQIELSTLKSQLVQSNAEKQALAEKNMSLQTQLSSRPVSPISTTPTTATQEKIPHISSQASRKTVETMSEVSALREQIAVLRLQLDRANEENEHHHNHNHHVLDILHHQDEDTEDNEKKAQDLMDSPWHTRRHPTISHGGGGQQKWRSGRKQQKKSLVDLSLNVVDVQLRKAFRSGNRSIYSRLIVALYTSAIHVLCILLMFR